MEFDIQPASQMAADHAGISLSPQLLEELGVLVGQCIEIRSRENLVLQVRNSLKFDNGYIAYVSPNNFEKIKDSPIEFEILEVTLGCDPEFFILYGNRLVSAATFLPFSGQIGCDGILGELRPRYGRHEQEVVANLRFLIQRIQPTMRRAAWCRSLPKDGREFRLEAHSFYHHYPAGFHVHLGIPPEILNTRKDFNRAAMNHIVQCLDWYVAVPLMPLETDHRRRIGGGQYGRPGDYRPSNVTLEYRVPGAFNLRSPGLAGGLLGMSLLLTENIVSRLKSISKGFVNLHRVTEADLHDVMPIPKVDAIKTALNATDPKVAAKHIDSIHTQLSGLPSYEKHQAEIEQFFRLVEKGQGPSANLLHNWKETP